jgi:hypothetical protein
MLQSLLQNSNRFLIAMGSLRHRLGIELLSLGNRVAKASQSHCIRMVIASSSLWNGFTIAIAIAIALYCFAKVAIAFLSIWNHFAGISFPLHDRVAIAFAHGLQSLCNLMAIAFQSLWNGIASIAIALPSLLNGFAIVLRSHCESFLPSHCDRIAIA